MTPADQLAILTEFAAAHPVDRVCDWPPYDGPEADPEPVSGWTADRIAPRHYAMGTGRA